MPTTLLLGVTGDVGQGIAAELLAAGHHVIGVSRNPAAAKALPAELASAPGLSILHGSVADSASAMALRSAVTALAPRLDTVIVSVNGVLRPAAVLVADAASLEEVWRNNLLVHQVAAQALLDLVADGGLYLGIGGGMADLVFPGYGAVAMCQAAQRVLYRFLAKETEGSPVHLRELMIYSMVAGEKKRDQAQPNWITDREVGRHVAAIIADPARFPGPILALRSRQQVGAPESARS